MRGAGGAAEVGAQAIRWLDERARCTEGHRRVFLYLHYLGIHAPYSAMPALLQRVTGAFDRTHKPGLFDIIPLANRLYLDGQVRPLTPVEIPQLTTVYDAAVLAIDRQLRSLFAEFARRGLLDDAVVIVTADHGEDFLEHGTIGHGRRLWETSIRVPLLLLVPGKSTRTDVTEPVSLVDVAPTVLDLIGVPPPAGFEGRSLLLALQRAEHPWSLDALRWRFRQWWTRPEDAIYAELPESQHSRPAQHRHALIQGTQKVIVARDGARTYFDLQADPDEQQADALGRDDRERLDRTLATFTDRFARESVATTARPLDPGGSAVPTGSRLRKLVTDEHLAARRTVQDQRFAAPRNRRCGWDRWRPT